MLDLFGSEALRPVGAEDVRRICGDLLDDDVVAILAIGPSLADLESAAVWAMTGDPATGRTLLSAPAMKIAERLASIGGDEAEDVPIAEARG